MTLIQISFIVIALGTVFAAGLVVTVRNLVHAAQWLIVTLFGVAVVFIFLNAGFLAVAQIVIYIGAIALLMSFAIMLTRKVMRDTGPQSNNLSFLAGLVSVLLFGGIIVLLRTWDGINSKLPVLNPEMNAIKDLGVALVSPNAYILPFEVASVLLLAALIGAIYIARDMNS